MNNEQYCCYQELDPNYRLYRHQFRIDVSRRRCCTMCSTHIVYMYMYVPMLMHQSVFYDTIFVRFTLTQDIQTCIVLICMNSEQCIYRMHSKQKRQCCNYYTTATQSLLLFSNFSVKSSIENVICQRKNKDNSILQCIVSLVTASLESFSRGNLMGSLNIYSVLYVF